MENWRTPAGVALRLAVAALVLSVTAIAWLLYAQRGAASRRVDPLLEDLKATTAAMRATSEEVRGLAAQVRRDYRDPDDPKKGLYWDIAASLETSTMASRTTEEMIEDVRAALMGGRDTRGMEHAGVFPETAGLLTDLRGVAQDARKELARLTDSADATLEPLAGALRRIETLAGTLEREIAAGGPEARGTLAALAGAVRDFDALLRDENVRKTLAHVEGSAESIDIALRPWRERAHVAKVILSKLAGLLKVNVVDLF